MTSILFPVFLNERVIETPLRKLLHDFGAAFFMRTFGLPSLAGDVYSYYL